MCKPVLVIVLSLCLLGCWGEEDKKARSNASSSLSEESMRKEAEQGIYRLAPSEKELAPKEKAKAQAIVDFANMTEHFLRKEACGNNADAIMRASEKYSSSFVLDPLPEPFPSDECAVKNALPPQGLIDEAIREEMKASLVEIDKWRVSMQNSYRYLRDYIADKENKDGGELGENLCLAIKGAYLPFELARKQYFTLLNSQAEAAQSRILQGHPLRMHIVYAKRIVESFRSSAALIGPVDADPDKMKKSLLALAKEIEIAENLPFPVAGLVEMEYRGFLKKSKQLHGCFMRGLTESFNEGIRKAINESWQASQAQYNRFVDALGLR